MDKYDSVNDRYWYSGTSLLKNKLNIKDENKLENAEREITDLTIDNEHSELKDDVELVKLMFNRWTNYSQYDQYRGQLDAEVSMLIGRFNPFHDGHKALIKKVYEEKGKPILIFVRMVSEMLNLSNRMFQVKKWLILLNCIKT